MIIRYDSRVDDMFCVMRIFHYFVTRLRDVCYGHGVNKLAFGPFFVHILGLDDEND